MLNDGSCYGDERIKCYFYRYISEPDHFLHLNGFKNGKLDKKMQELDLLVKYINDKLENNPNLSKQLNIILTSDHGHAEVCSIIYLFTPFFFLIVYLS